MHSAVVGMKEVKNLTPTPTGSDEDLVITVTPTTDTVQAIQPSSMTAAVSDVRAWLEVGTLPHHRRTARSRGLPEPIKSLLRHSDLLDSAAHEQHVDDMVGTRLEPYTSDQVRANVRGIDGGVVRLGSGEEEGEFAAAVVGFDDDGGAEVGKDEAPRPGGDECQCQAKFGGRLGRNSKNFVHELCRELCHGGCSALDELVIG